MQRGYQTEHYLCVLLNEQNTMNTIKSRQTLRKMGSNIVRKNELPDSSKGTNAKYTLNNSSNFS